MSHRRSSMSLTQAHEETDMTATALVILADADNTLWDTDAVFAKAQLVLLAQVELTVGIQLSSENRLEFVRAYDQALAARHHLHLKYPPQMLVSALAAGLRSTTPDAAATAIIGGDTALSNLDSGAIEAAISAYLNALRETPSMLPTVVQGIHLAQHPNVALYVMTEGRVDKQRGIVTAHGLNNDIAGVWELTKDRAQFERLRRRFEGSTVVVIGDQPDRDIIPATQAGCLAVLVPSRFRPKWQKTDDWAAASYVASDFAEAIRWGLAKAPCAIEQPQ